MADSKTARFSVKLDDGVSAAANAGADSMEALTKRIQAGDSALKTMNGDLRRLKGTSDEVKKAKGDLKTKIDAERNAVSAANLKIIQGGKSYTALAEAGRKQAVAAAQGAKLQEAASAAKRAELKKALDTAIAGSKGEAAASAETAAGAEEAAAALGGLYVAAAAVAVAGVAGIAMFAKFAIEGANAARSAGLVREGLLGSGEEARRMGNQIDELSRKVPTAKGDIQALALSLFKSGMSGQPLVDTMNAVGQASAALGDDVGNKLRGILQKGVLPNGAKGFIGIGPNELRNTGLAFEDVAKSLAKGTKTSVAQATQALLAGRVPLAQGAAAIRAAVESKVGKVNAAKMLDLDVMKAKFGEALGGLTKNIKLEPLLEGISKFFKLFDSSTQTGKVLTDVVTRLGNGLVNAFTRAAPIVEYLFLNALLLELKLELAFYNLRNVLIMAFRTSIFDGFMQQLRVVAAMVDSITGGVFALEQKLNAFSGPKIGKIELPPSLAAKPEESRAAGNVTGTAITDGIANGIKAGSSNVLVAGNALVEALKAKFTSGLEIHSPSKVFARYGVDVTAGFAEGVERGSGGANAAVEQMVQTPTGGARSSSSSTTTVTVPITINVTSDHAAASMREPSFMAQLTKAIEEICVGVGVPVQGQGFP